MKTFLKALAIVACCVASMVTGIVAFYCVVFDDKRCMNGSPINTFKKMTEQPYYVDFVEKKEQTIDKIEIGFR